MFVDVSEAAGIRGGHVQEQRPTEIIEVGDSNVGTILGCRTGGLDGETVGGFHNSLEPSAGTERTEAVTCVVVRDCTMTRADK